MNDLFQLKSDNSRLKDELQFAHNLIDLLEDYRSLMTVCVRSCDNCAKSGDILAKYQYLESTYHKHKEFAKQKHLNRFTTDTTDTKNADHKTYDSIAEAVFSDEDLSDDDDQYGSDSEPESKATIAEPPLTARTKSRTKNMVSVATHSATPLGCSWPGCERTFLTRKKLSKHMAVHNPCRQYQCDQCEYSHRKLANLESHKNKVHRKVRPFKCDKCAKDFTGKPVLDKHKRKVHNESESVYHHCDWADCQFKTKYWNNLKEHKLRHTGDRPFKCCWPGCDKCFYNNKDLTIHVKTAHESAKDLLCDWPGCGAAFKRAYCLARHKKLHDPDALEMCQWPGCGQAFNRKDKLKQHMNGHKKGAPVTSVSRRVNQSANSPQLAVSVGHSAAKSTPHPFDLSHRAGMATMAALPFIQPQASVRWPTLLNTHQ